MGIGNTLVVSSAIDDERVGRPGDALGRLLRDLSDQSLISGIGSQQLRGRKRKRHDSSVLGDTMRRKGHVSRKSESRDKGVLSSSKRLMTGHRIELLKSVDGTKKKSVDANRIPNDQRVLANDLAAKIESQSQTKSGDAGKETYSMT